VLVPETVHIVYGEDAVLIIQAEDLSGIDHYWVSDTVRFSVDEMGL
jgi:hypothetical protein